MDAHLLNIVNALSPGVDVTMAVVLTLLFFRIKKTNQKIDQIHHMVSRGAQKIEGSDYHTKFSTILSTVIAIKLDVERTHRFTHGLNKSNYQEYFKQMVLDTSKMQRLLNDLHTWHDARDNDGRFRWWFPESFLFAMKDLTKSMEDFKNVICKQS